VIRVVDLLAFVLIVMVGFGIWGYKNNYFENDKTGSFVMLDVLSIIESQREKIDAQMRLNNKILSDSEIEALVVQQVAQLEKAVNAYAKENGLIILERGAIVAGDVKDVTDEFLKAIQ